MYRKCAELFPVGSQDTPESFWRRTGLPWGDSWYAAAQYRISEMLAKQEANKAPRLSHERYNEQWQEGGAL